MTASNPEEATVHPAHRSLLTLAIAAALAAVAGSAAAQVAVTRVPGDRTRCRGECYDAVVAAIEGHGLEAVQAPAGSRRTPGRGLTRAGAEMLLIADIVGPRGRRAVRLRGYLADGTCFYDERERTRSARHAARILGAMVSDLLDGEGLASLEEEEEEDRRAREEEEEEPRTFGDDEEEEEEPPVRTFGQDDEDAEEGEGEVRARARVDDPAHGTFLWLHAGINLTARTMEMPLDGEEAPREYRGGAYPGFEVSGAVYPAAPWVPTWPGNIGVFARYGRHIALTTYSDGTALETNQDQLDVAAQYRWPLLGRRSGVALIPSLGYMRVAFQVPDGSMMDDFVYQAMSVGLELEAPLPWAGLMIRAGGRYGMVLDMGQVGRAVAQAATVHGYEAQLELSGRIVAGLRYVVAFEVFGFESQFVGHGDLAQAEGAHDVFYRGRAGLAYSFEAGGS